MRQCVLTCFVVIVIDFIVCVNLLLVLDVIYDLLVIVKDLLATLCSDS